MKRLPEEIVSSAFTAVNGEYAWQRADVFTALRVIAQTGQAILGGEAWAIEDKKTWAMIPDTRGETGIWAWETLPYKATELWSDYCFRTCDESIRVIQEMEVENAVDQQFSSHIFYNLTYIEQNEID
jgi:hypothetical protein